MGCVCEREREGEGGRLREIMSKVRKREGGQVW